MSDDMSAIVRVERFARSPNTTIEEHDDLMVVTRLARVALATVAPPYTVDRTAPEAKP
jgi:hypothetical protein